MRFICAATFLSLLSAPSVWAAFDDGLTAYKAKDYPAAVREWRPLANDGNVKAQYMLGRVYFQVYQDYRKAVKWYKKAAEQGHAAAQYSLSGMYRDGINKQMLWPLNITYIKETIPINFLAN